MTAPAVLRLRSVIGGLLVVTCAMVELGCATEPDDMALIKVETLYGANEQYVLSHSFTVELSDCVANAMDDADADQIEDWRSTVCDPDATGSSITCNDVAVETDGNRLTFVFDTPRGYYSPDFEKGYFSLGPFPTPDASTCDPLVFLVEEAPYLGDQVLDSNCDPIPMRADGEIYGHRSDDCHP